MSGERFNLPKRNARFTEELNSPASEGVSSECLRPGGRGEGEFGERCRGPDGVDSMLLLHMFPVGAGEQGSVLGRSYRDCIVVLLF